jgi:hypothetical protein
MHLSEQDGADSDVGRVRLKDLSRPEDFVTLPRLDLAGAEFHWQVGYTVTYFGSYLDQPVFFELLRRDAVLAEPSFEDFRYLVIELTNDQFEQAKQLDETAKKARKIFDDKLAANQNRYTRAADEFRIQVRHMGEQLGRQYRENVVLGWIDGRPNVPDPRDIW